MQDHVATILEQWQRQVPDLDVSPVGVFGRVTRIERYKAAVLREVYRRHHIDGGEYDVLAALRRTGPPHLLTPTALARGVLVKSGTMTERVDRLEQRGFVKRTRSTRDRRSVSVELTTAGRALVEAAAADLVAAQAQLLEGLAEPDRQALARLLAILCSLLERDA